VKRHLVESPPSALQLLALTGRYARWRGRAQNEHTRRKLISPARYLLASDLAELSLDSIGTAEINAYVEWRRSMGALSFSTRKNGQRYRARVEQVGSQTIDKSLKLLSAALHLAKDENLIASVPKIHFLPEDDARAIVPPTEEQHQKLLHGAEQLRPIAPLLPEVVELLGEFGLRPGELFHLTWGSVDWSLGQGENRGALRVEEQQRIRMLGGERWIPKNRKHRTIPFTLRGRAILEALHAKASPKADELVIPNTHGLPYIRLDEGPMKGGSAGAWNQLREISGVEAVAMRDLRHFFAVACLSRGIPISTVSAWMGHSEIDLTVKRYGRFAAEAREQWTWAALRAEPVEHVASRGAGLKVVK
jgi:integrase